MTLMTPPPATRAPPVALRGEAKRWSVREGPEAQLFLGDRPQTREPVGLDDQEEHDQGAKDHRFEVRYRGRADLPAEQRAERRQRLVEEDRQQHDEGRPQHAAQYRAQATDDDHEHELEGAVDREG